MALVDLYLREADTHRQYSPASPMHSRETSRGLTWLARMVENSRLKQMERCGRAGTGASSRTAPRNPPKVGEVGVIKAGLTLECRTRPRSVDRPLMVSHWPRYDLTEKSLPSHWSVELSVTAGVETLHVVLTEGKKGQRTGFYALARARVRVCMSIYSYEGQFWFNNVIVRKFRLVLTNSMGCLRVRVRIRVRYGLDI